MVYSWSSFEGLGSALVRLLESRHPGLVTDVRVGSEGDTVVLSGEVASEACKGDAKRLALAFEGVFKVRNELVVAAFLEAASDPDLDDYFKSGVAAVDAADRGSWPPITHPSQAAGGPPRSGQGTEAIQGSVSQSVEVARHPLIHPSGVPHANEWMDLTIDLKDVPQDGATSLSLGRFPEGWTEIEILVQLVVPWACRTDTRVATITLMADGASKPASFRCLVSPEYVEGSPAQVQAIFLHGTRICGHVVSDVCRTAVVDASVPHAQPSPTPVRTETAFSTGFEAVGPHVSVSIMKGGVGAQIWLWTAFVPGGTNGGTGRVDLEGEGREFAESLLKTCPNLKAGKFQRVMDGIGEKLWDIAPLEFRNAYAGWLSTIGEGFAIQFVTDDPYVPWEMMKPRLPGARHMFLDHPVARWPLSRAGRRRDRFGGGDLLSFVPKYKKHDALSFAIAEGEWVCDKLHGCAMPADTTTFLDVLDGKHPRTVGMLHFAGHGCEHTGVSSGGIELEDDVVSVTDVHQQRVVLGQRDGTLIVLNACETSAGARLLGMNTGWGAAIADREFGGLIAPIWEVQDEVAFSIMQGALPALLDGRDSLGEALRHGRLTSSESSVAAFAYLAHGDVMARFPATP